MIMRYHFILTRMSIIKRRKEHLLAKMWRNWNPQTSLVGMYNGAATLESSLAVFQKVKPKVTIPSNTTPRYYTQEKWKIIFTDLYTNVCSGITHNRRTVEIIQMSWNLWMSKLSGISLQWNSVWQLKGNYMLQHGWDLKIYQLQKTLCCIIPII